MTKGEVARECVGRAAAGQPRRRPLDEGHKSCTVLGMPKTRPVLTGLLALGVALSGVGVAAWTLPHARIEAATSDEAYKTTANAGDAAAANEQVAASQTDDPSPARKAVSETLARLPELMPDWQGVMLQEQRFVSPVPLRCSAKEDTLYQGRTWFAQRPGKPGAVSVNVLAGGPGYGQHLNFWLVRQLSQCSAQFTNSSPSTTTARVDGVSLRGWVRGDVLVTVTADSRIENELEPVSAVVDSVLLEELEGVCADTSPSSGESRNPYLGSAFTGLLARVGVASIGAGALDLPEPLPSPTWQGPEPRAFPELALPDPAGPELVSPEPTQAAELNERITGPLLIDPEEVEPPAVEQTTPPVKPASPARRPLGSTEDVPIPDPVGPGCGWAFLGLNVPQVNPDALKVQAQQVLDAAVQQSAQDLFEQLLAQANYQRAWERYQEVAYEWAAYEQYQELLDQALKDLEDARREWEAAIAELTRPEPTPSPSNTTEPDNGTAEPSPSPTPTPTPSTSPSPATPSPSPSPTASGSLSPSPSEQP